MRLKTKIKIYWNYLKYILEHKKNVLLECFKEGMYWHGIIHDFSRLLPCEFKAYAEKFYGGDYAYKYHEVENDFTYAWLHHINNNPHHWNYWILDKEAIPMPKKYIKQMVCDWRAMGKKFGDTAVDFYNKENKDMILHKNTRDIIENELQYLLFLEKINANLASNK